MKRLIFLFSLISAISLNLQAQGDIEALRYSRYFYGGSARSSAMGGAFGALGADFSSISINPAGLGLYRSTEFSMTPSFNVTNASSKYFGADGDYQDFDYKLNLNNLGIVSVIPTGNESGVKSINLGFGYNRIADFDENSMIEGTNFNSSFLDKLSSNADGIHPLDLNPYLERLAFDSYLLDTIPGTYDYVNAAPRSESGDIVPEGILQRKISSKSGKMNETLLSMGFNVSDRLYFGLAVGFIKIKYNEENSYFERNNSMEQTIDYFRDYTFSESLFTTGSGYNFKIGFIGRPVDFVRLGVSFHSPSFLSIQEDYMTNMKANYDLPDVDGYSSYNRDPYDPNTGDKLTSSLYEYDINTPLRATGSVAFIIQKMGLISVDYEYVDYSRMRMRFGVDEKTYELEVNNNIESLYQATHNIRIGAEFRISSLYLRGGYALYGSPLKKMEGIQDATVSVYSAGIGINAGSFFFDVAYSLNQSSYTQFLYDNNIPTGADIERINSKLMATMGLRFGK